MKNRFILFTLIFCFYSCDSDKELHVGKTSITKWKDAKRAAISITYDDGIINQFTIARPIMNNLGLPATFYIITGKIDSAAKGKFIGRNQEKIIIETALNKTDSTNFFERASLIGFTGTTEGVEYHSNAGSLFEREKITEAYQVIDEGFEKLRKGQLKNSEKVIFHDNREDTTTWSDLKIYAAEGHEIASHTVTHPRLAVLDEPNLLYELEQSKADIKKFMGESFTFSAECPYGTEDERVMEYAHKIYPSLRNRMPETYLDEINRASQKQPNTSEKEYVQWQRGPLTRHSMELMESWVDTCLAHDNIWLVLVFHGVDNLGWEPKTKGELEEYFQYIKAKDSDVWVATFADVTKYLRKRKNTTIQEEVKGDKVFVEISSDLDSKVYNIPITLKTYVSNKWNTALFYPKKKKEEPIELEVKKDDVGNYVIYSVSADIKEIILEKKN